MKKLKIILGIIFLSGCSTNSIEEQKDETVQHIEVSIDHDYEEIDEYEIFWNDIFTINNNDYFVYFYSMTCNHCADLKNYIIEKALLMKNIYFVKNCNAVKISKNTTSTINKGDIENFCILGYPSLIKVQNGICKKNVAGSTQIKDLLK